MECAGETVGLNHHNGAFSGQQERLVPSAWCRAQGICPAELAQWCASATTARAELQDARTSPQATRQGRKRIKEPVRELLRNDRSLAETAALLVLSKKVAAIYQKGEDA